MAGSVVEDIAGRGQGLFPSIQNGAGLHRHHRHGTQAALRPSRNTKHQPLPSPQTDFQYKPPAGMGALKRLLVLAPAVPRDGGRRGGFNLRCGGTGCRVRPHRLLREAYQICMREEKQAGALAHARSEKRLRDYKHTRLPPAPSR
ncbi:hypothetical protein SKAU_G00125320 [Synaphobranchus kaupii]|uniref:Uncharacterized protein n=1 Tax=Synaphobranchus kaupii TaxID=118154 RepID=A0A9Q1FPB9_SYNKA|nr:hypothetical protein SKAU_G00125320 [Synaphobranchus kaupii]